MQLSPGDSGMDWNKILESIEEVKIPKDMTQEEFSAMAAAREARALLAAQEFDESDGWQQFMVMKEKQRTRRLRILRLAVAASLALAIGAGAWLLAPKGKQDQLASAAPSGKVRLKTADGRVIDLEKDVRTIQDDAIAQVRSGGDSLVYTAGSASSAAVKMDTLEVPRGLPFQLTLADGSRVWLNAASRLAFPAAFNGASREVFLEGEGYFEVAPNAKQAFLVHTGKTITTVLGTAFNIRAYGKSVVTTLSSGKVKVAADGEALYLQPDEQSTFDPENGSLLKQTVDARDHLAWVNGELYFDAVPLDRITESLERSYDYEFEFSDPATAKLRFTLDMPRPARLNEVLTQLKTSRTDLRFTIEGRKVTIARQP